MASSAAVYAALLATGLLGSFGHCVGMCGPLVTMISLRAARSATEHRRPVSLPRSMLLYHGARIGVYAALGAIVGLFGSLVGLGASLNVVAAGLSLLLGISVIAFGMAFLGWLPASWSVRAGSCVTGSMGRLLGPQARHSVVLLGALNGLLPCGLVYSALLVAGSSGGVGSSALAMLLFGLGTVPTLLFLGLGFGALRVRTRQTLVRGAGFLMVLTGLQLILRGAAAAGVVPPLHFGGLVLW